MTDTTATENAEATETVIGSAAAVDTVPAAAADDKIENITPFQAEADTLAGADSADTVEGGEAADTVSGSEAADSISGAEAYEGLVAPDGFAALDDEALAKATPIFRELGIDTTEKAQDTINKFAPIIQDISAKAVTAAAAEQESAINAQSAAWAEECRKLPDFDKLKTDAARFRDTFVKTPEAKALVAELPIFNHPLILQLFADGGRALASDQIAHGDQNAGNKPTTFADAAYGNFKAEPANP